MAIQKFPLHFPLSATLLHSRHVKLLPICLWSSCDRFWSLSNIWWSCLLLEESAFQSSHSLRVEFSVRHETLNKLTPQRHRPFGFSWRHLHMILAKSPSDKLTLIFNQSLTGWKLLLCHATWSNATSSVALHDEEPKVVISFCAVFCPVTFLQD